MKTLPAIVYMLANRCLILKLVEMCILKKIMPNFFKNNAYKEWI
jgi:hypothetical protein